MLLSSSELEMNEYNSISKLGENMGRETTFTRSYWSSKREAIDVDADDNSLENKVKNR